MEHETPTIEIFNELKEAATTVWNTFDNTYGYVTEKLEIVNSIENYADNVMISYRMFDNGNQRLMRQELSSEALSYINNNL